MVSALDLRAECQWFDSRLGLGCRVVSLDKKRVSTLETFSYRFLACKRQTANV